MSLLLYGVNGYTGVLVAERAVERGLAPILAGRRAEAIEPLARRLGVPFRVFALDDARAIARGLEGVKVLLNCAGPFTRTAEPLVAGCLAARAHYLDLTGEVAVFEAVAKHDAAARAAGVMLLPGAGFDVVPSDCLAVHLARRVPGANHLTLALAVKSRTSHGTATTLVENIGAGGLIRRDGQLTRVPAAWRTRRFDLGEGPEPAVTLPWGDLATAYRSTGIPNIEIYFAAPAHMRAGLRATRVLGPLLASAPVQRWLKARIKAGPAGPSARHRQSGEAVIFGEVANAAGARASARLRTPEAYELTRLVAVLLCERALAGTAPAGFQTPATAYGADVILEIPGVQRTDLEQTR